MFVVQFCAGLGVCVGTRIAVLSRNKKAARRLLFPETKIRETLSDCRAVSAAAESPRSEPSRTPIPLARSRTRGSNPCSAALPQRASSLPAPSLHRDPDHESRYRPKPSPRLAESREFRLQRTRTLRHRSPLRYAQHPDESA